MPLPTGTVTFLFTDIQGSTQLWQAHPDAMPNALARHHDLLRQAIEANDGYVFQIIGDAFCAAFHTALDGLNAAIAAQRLLRDEAWGETGEIRVRMALHSGAAEVRAGEFTSGEYVSGLTLSRAARLLSAGHGGQILLSMPANELVRDHLPKDMTLQDMGPHRLKDLIRPEHIYQAAVPDLPASFPALKTLDARPNNLPLQLTSFIGREKEMSELHSYLSPHPAITPHPPELRSSTLSPLGRGKETETPLSLPGRGAGGEGGTSLPGRGVGSEGRLITLLGPGGAGKTRLALQLGADLIDEFKDGAWFVDLSPLSDPQLIPQEVAGVWDLRESAGQPILSTLLEYLHSRQLLLIVDNCEHLVEPAARFIETALRSSSGLRVLATSREALNISSERIFRLASLSLPDLEHLPPPEALSQFEAVRLFIDRAQAVRPEFAITSKNAPAVAQVCQRLDGIPLAIELAAARLRALTVEQINSRLEDRFRLLTGGSRTALPRQQTLQATVDWSYNLLEEPERLLLRRLAVFSGGWSLDAVEAIGVNDLVDSYEVLDLVTRLADKSLVVSEEAPGGMRYRLLDTIRAYALQHLRAADEEDAMKRRHLDYFLSLAGQFQKHFEGPDQLLWIDMFEQEHDNLRAALRFALEQDVEKALLLCNGLWMFWFSRGHFVEGRRWIEAAWAAAEGVQVSDRARSMASYVLGSFLYFQGEIEPARQVSLRGLELARSVNDRRGELISLHHLGMVEQSDANYPLSREYLDNGIELARQVHDRMALAVLLNDRAHLALAEGQTRLAAKYFEEDMRLSKAAGDEWTLSYALGNLASLAINDGEFDKAAEMLKDTMILNHKFRDKHALAYALTRQAYLKARRPDLISDRGNLSASQLMEQAFEMESDLGRQKYIPELVENLVEYFLADRQFEQAARLLGVAAALRQELDAPIEKSWGIDVARFADVTRQAMGDEAYQREFQRGQGMTLEEALLSPATR